MSRKTCRKHMRNLWGIASRWHLRQKFCHFPQTEVCHWLIIIPDMSALNLCADPDDRGLWPHLIWSKHGRHKKRSRLIWANFCLIIIWFWHLAAKIQIKHMEVRCQFNIITDELLWIRRCGKLNRSTIYFITEHVNKFVHLKFLFSQDMIYQRLNAK